MKRNVLDPGHGGSDPGATGNGLRESDLNLKMCFFIKEALDDGWEDHETIMTRTEDIYPSRSERIAHTAGADRYIEVHFNSHSSTAHGFESFIWPNGHNGIRILPATENFQNTVHNEVASVMRSLGVTDRGKKTGAYIMLGRAQCSALLLEYLFISNPREAAIAKSDANLRKMAMATAEGIARDLKLDRKKQEPVPPPRMPDSPPKVQRTIRVEVNGKMTNIVGYLINNRTYLPMLDVGRIIGAEVTGHGDHIKVRIK